MKSSNRNSLDEQTRLVSRYVAGDLSRSERAQFEAWLVASPELAAEVEMERRLRRGLASAARRGWITRDSPLAKSRDRHWQIALAASVLLGLGLALTVRMSHRTESLSAGAQNTARGDRLAAARTVRLSAFRGAGGTPDVTVSLNDVPGELLIEPDVVMLTCEDGSVELEFASGGAPQTPAYPEYDMDLVRRHGSTLAWRSPRQEPVARGRLSFVLRDPGSLAVGDYDLVVRGHSPDHEEVVARFWLRVTSK